MILKLHNRNREYTCRRLCSVFLAILLLLPICSAMSYVGVCNKANLTANREVRPGHSYRVRLVMDSTAVGYEGYFSYDSSVLTLVRAIPVNNDLYVDFQVSTETGYVRVTHSQPVRYMLDLTFAVSSKAKIGSETTVRFHSGSLIHENTTEPINDVSFSFLFVEKKSDDATLRALDVSVFRSESDREQNKNPFYASLSPAFSSSQRSYSVTVPNEFSHFSIKAKANDSAATVASVSKGELTEGIVNSVDITVRAEDGTEFTYTLQIFRESYSENSTNISDIISDTSLEESSEEESADESSEESEEPDASSESQESFEESDFSEVLSVSDVSSDESSVDSDTSSWEESKADDSSDYSDNGSSISPSLAPIPSEDSGLTSKNWTGLFFCIAAVSALSITVLVIRILFLFHKKRH